MAFTVPPLPFAMDALEPYMSSKTLSYHYGKHNKAYNDTLNNLIKGTDYETMPLEEIIRTTQSGPIFNNAAQCYNHTFFWNSLKPNGGGQPRLTPNGAATTPLQMPSQIAPSVTSVPAGPGWLKKKTAHLISSIRATPAHRSPEQTLL